MIFHVHSKNGHGALVPLVTQHLAVKVCSLDPLPDGSTVSAIELSSPSLLSHVLNSVDGVTVIPKAGAVGKKIAVLLSHYGINDNHTKRDILAELFTAQPNIFFDPSLIDA